MQTINFYCKKCKRSLHVSYQVTGNEMNPVLSNIFIKCTNCKRVIVLKKYTEKQILDMAKGDRVYI